MNDEAEIPLLNKEMVKELQVALALALADAAHEPNAIVLRPKPDDWSDQDWHRYVEWLQAGCPD